jgi:hypothetical protein
MEGGRPRPPGQWHKFDGSVRSAAPGRGRPGLHSPGLHNPGLRNPGLCKMSRRVRFYATLPHFSSYFISP